ncbi:hypothetical protein R1sor_009979 [Riccia sorocarpa]|uniref:Maturase K n=1 Tax=Riccia sorocarpa TaxID=122646 RepID=A0ABD3HWY0_9MARC
MSSESGGSKPPVQEIISSSSTGTPTRSYFLNYLFKLQHLPTHFLHTLFAEFRALVLPLRYIRPPSPPRSPGGHFCRHALYSRDGVFVTHTRELRREELRRRPTVDVASSFGAARLAAGNASTASASSSFGTPFMPTKEKILRIFLYFMETNFHTSDKLK